MESQINIQGLFKEINDVFNRYGVERSIGFVPDKLEINLTRDGDIIFLTYSEFFTYLPSEVLEIATENAVEFLKSLGIPQEKIKRLKDGVEVKIEGDARITYFPILEILIQDRNITHNIEPACESLKNSIGSLTRFFDFSWSWDDNIKSKWCNSLAKLQEILDKNPEMQKEINDIIKKHTNKSKYLESNLTKI